MYRIETPKTCFKTQDFAKTYNESTRACSLAQRVRCDVGRYSHSGRRFPTDFCFRWSRDVESAMGGGLRGHKLEANRALVDLSVLRKLYSRVRSVKTQDEKSRG